MTRLAKAMLSFGLFILCAAIAGAAEVCLTKNVDFSMWSDPEIPALILVDRQGNTIRDLGMSEFTHCLYFFVEYGTQHEYHSLISYSSASNNMINEIGLWIRPTKRETTVIVHDKTGTIQTEYDGPYLFRWQHVCFSWSSSSRIVRLYLDGNEVGSITEFSEAKDIGTDGHLILGQDQDKFGGGFEAADGLRGRITQFNVWNKTLTAQEVRGALEGSLYGNVVDWRTASWRLKGKVAILRSTVQDWVSV